MPRARRGRSRRTRRAWCRWRRCSTRAEDALREALALRGRIEDLAGAAPGTPLGDALDELFGLVELGLAGRS